MIQIISKSLYIPLVALTKTAKDFQQMIKILQIYQI